MTEPQPIGACAILINDRRQVLLGKRRSSYKAGMYGLPGGRIELGEPTRADISREVLEETGLGGLELSFVGVVRETQGTCDFIHYVFVAQIDTLEPKLCEPEKYHNYHHKTTPQPAQGVW